jgi:hypothetical protein
MSRRIPQQQLESYLSRKSFTMCEKRMVGERGFEPPTPWSRTNNRCTKLLFRLGLFCVFYRLFAWCPGTIGPKLDPNAWVINRNARPGLGTLYAPLKPHRFHN